MLPKILRPEQVVTSTHSPNITSVAKTSFLISIIGAGGKTSCIFWLAEKYRQQQLKVLITTSTKMYLPEKHQFNKLINLEHVALDELTKNRFQDEVNNAGVYFAYDGLLTNKSITNQEYKAIGLSEEKINQLKAINVFDVILVEADGAKHHFVKCPSSHEPAIPANTDIVIAVTGADCLSQPANEQTIHRLSEFCDITHCQYGESIKLTHLQALISHPQGMFKGSPPNTPCIWLLNKAEKNQINSTQLEALFSCQRQLAQIWLADLDQPILQQVISPPQSV